MLLLGGKPKREIKMTQNLWFIMNIPCQQDWCPTIVASTLKTGRTNPLSFTLED